MDLEESLTALDKVLRYSAKVSTLHGLTAEVGGYVGAKLPKGKYKEDPHNEAEHWGENLAPEDIRKPQWDTPGLVKSQEWTQKWSEENLPSVVQRQKESKEPKTY